MNKKQKEHLIRLGRKPAGGKATGACNPFLPSFATASCKPKTPLLAAGEIKSGRATANNDNRWHRRFFGSSRA